MINLTKIRGKKAGDFTSSYAKGLAAETKAARLLEAGGYEVLARRAKTSAGELDLVLKAPRQNRLVFVEVKTRADLRTAAYAISADQQQRLLRAADTWMGTKPQYAGFGLRFDAFLIDRAGQTRHIENAFGLS